MALTYVVRSKLWGVRHLPLPRGEWHALGVRAGDCGHGSRLNHCSFIICYVYLLEQHTLVAMPCQLPCSSTGVYQARRSTQSLHAFHSAYSSPITAPSYRISSPLPSVQAFRHVALLPFHPAFRIKLTSVSSLVQPCSFATSGRYVEP